MENNFMLNDEMLWDYADGFLNGEEKLRVDSYLRQHPEYQARLEAILSEKRAFSGLSLEKPNTGFAQQVMSAWAVEQSSANALAPAKNKGQDWIMWSIGAAFILMITIPFFMAPSTVPVDGAYQIPEEFIPQMQIPTFDWAGLFSSALLSNIVLLTMAFMGLKILDKYLQVRNLRIAGH